MKFDELIYKRLSQDKQLASFLTEYAGKSAIFFQEAPDDKQFGWEHKIQYPRLCYSINKQANQERKSAGTLCATVYCAACSEVMPERIEPEVIRLLRDVLVVPENDSPYCFTWSRTDSFDVEGQRMDIQGGGISGCDIWFDLIEYPEQETTDPDPIVSMNMTIKKIYPESLVIGLDTIADIVEASVDKPIFYCRLESIEKDRETNTVTWINCRISIHLLCPESSVRRKMITAVAQYLSLKGEITMLDHSPMFMKGLQLDHEADYLIKGQLYVIGNYGLLRYKAKPYGLGHAKLNYQRRHLNMSIENKEIVTNKEQKATIKGMKTEKAALKQTESLYKVEELAENAISLFGVKKECVIAALITANITSCTLSQAKSIVEVFMKKEVQ